jgi:uncharacterized membrane protein
MSIIAITALGVIGTTIGVIFLTLFIIRKINEVWDDGEPRKSAMPRFVISMIGFAVLAFAIVGYYNFTAVGEQQIKSWNAQTAGLNRTVDIYSMTGELISEYKGKFNIEYDTERVEIYDVNKKERVIVYYKNGTVIVTEPESTEEST